MVVITCMLGVLSVLLYWRWMVLAGSDFPAWDRNPQTGGDLFTSAQMRPATLAIVTGGASTLSLPLERAN